MKEKFGFNIKYLRGDLFGGITAGIVALPLALAFGVSSGLGPSAGLYGAIFISFFAALFGGTNTQISGPTAPMTAVSIIVIASIIAELDGDVTRALPVILTVFLLAGLMQIGLGFLGLGRYIKYIPYPVVSGFMTAIGVIILITQMLPAIGYYAHEDESFVDQFKPVAHELIIEKIIKDEVGDETLVLEDLNQSIIKATDISTAQIIKESKTLAKAEASGVIGTLKLLPRAFSRIDWLEFLLALATILIIFGFKKITTAVPSTLVALVLVSGVAIAFNLDYRPIDEIPSGLPLPNFEIFSSFSLSSIIPYFFSAFTIALLGAIDSLLTSIVADNMTKTLHKPNQELIGQGIGNTIASIFGGLPGAGATIRTVVNINAGGKTKLSGMIAAVLLLIILLALGPIASLIPAAVLAGILITVGIGVMDYKGLRVVKHMPKPEVAVMFIVLILSSVWNLVYAVGIGLVIASLMFMKKIGDLTASRSSLAHLDESKWSDHSMFPKNLEKLVSIKSIEGPLFFGSTSDFVKLSKQIPSSAKSVLFRLDSMQYMDQSGLFAMEEVLLELVRRNTSIWIVGLMEQPRYMMEKIDIIPDLVHNNQIFDEFVDCVRAIQLHHSDSEDYTVD